MRRFSVCSTVAALAVLLTTHAVQAEVASSPPAEGSAGGGASTATASFNSASANHGRGLGIGAATMLNGTSGALVTWGTSGFHVDGLVGLHRYTDGNATTSFTVGGRGWYHLHAASFADFSLGGGLGLIRWVSRPGTPQSDTHYDVALEVGGQIRAFIVPNVALTSDLGLGMLFADNDDILFGGQSIGGGGFVSGTMGIAYFFE